MKKDVLLDKEPVVSLFFKYYFPALTSMLAITIHQIVDGLILAEYVGKTGTAAVGLFSPIITIFIAFTLTLVIGGGILIGKNLGAQQKEQAQNVFQFTTTLAVLFGIIVALIAPFFTTSIIQFQVGSEDPVLRGNAYDYAFWGFLWIPFFLLRMVWGNAVSHDGAPKISRNASLLAVVLNIVLDVLFVMVFKWGTAGASIATGISVFASTVYLAVYFIQGKGHLSLKAFKFSLKLKVWKELLYHGLPSLVSEISFSIGLLLINRELVGFGPLAVSAFGIVNYLSFIFLRLFTAAMVSVLPIMSFNIGAKQPKRVLKTMKFGLVYSLSLGLLVCAIGFLFPEFLISIFSGEESLAFEVMAVRSMNLFFLLFLAAGANYVLGAYLQSIGKSALTILLNLLKGLVLVVLGLLVLPNYFGIDGVWLSRSLSEILAFIIIFTFILLKKKDFFSAKVILNRK